jgi:hypothetical protein
VAIKSMKFYFIVFILFLFHQSFSQKILDLHYRSLFGKEKHFQFFNNAEFSYRLKGQLFYRTEKVVNMNDSMLIFINDRVVKLHDIKSIRISGIKLSSWFYAAGFLFLAGDSFNNLINKDTPIVKERSINVAAYSILGGLIMQYFQDKHVRINKTTELKVLDLDFQNLNQN